MVFAIAGGIGVTAVGYFTPFMIAGSMIMAIGAGLLLLFRVDTPMLKWYVTDCRLTSTNYLFIDLS